MIPSLDVSFLIPAIVSSRSAIIEKSESDSSSFNDVNSEEEQKVSLNHITLSTKSPVRGHARGSPSSHALNFLYANDPDVSLSSYSELSEDVTPAQSLKSEEAEGEGSDGGEGGESEKEEGEESEHSQEEQNPHTSLRKPSLDTRNSIPIKDVQRYGNILSESFNGFKTEMAADSSEPTEETKGPINKFFGKWKKYRGTTSHDMDSDSELEENLFNTNRNSFVNEENEEEVRKNREEILKGLAEKQRMHQIEKECITPDVVEFYDHLKLVLYRHNESDYLRMGSGKPYDPTKDRDDEDSFEITPSTLNEEISPDDNLIYMEVNEFFQAFDPDDYEKLIKSYEYDLMYSDMVRKSPLKLNQPFELKVLSSGYTISIYNVEGIDGKNDEDILK